MTLADLQNLAAVTFDLDGTLYPEYRMALPTLAVALRHPRLVYCFSRARKDVRSVSEAGDFRRRQAEFLAARLGSSVARAQELTERVIYGRWLDSLRRLRPFPGMRSLILELRAAGYKTALMSDMPIEKKLRVLGLEGLWDCAYTAEESGVLKPNARAFARMLDTLAVPPDRIMYIGNNYEYDVVGAARAGMVTGLISARRDGRRRADFNFRNDRELKAFLRSLLSNRRPADGGKNGS